MNCVWDVGSDELLGSGALKVNLHSLVGLIYPATKSVLGARNTVYTLRLGSVLGGAPAIRCFTWLDPTVESVFCTVCSSLETRDLPILQMFKSLIHRVIATPKP
jgi:hypothetical protein